MPSTFGPLPGKPGEVGRFLRITASCPLREALQLVDIRVLDHMIVADNGCLSFAEHGLM